MVDSQLIIIALLTGILFSIILLWLEMRNRQFNQSTISTFLDAASIPSFRNSVDKINKELSRARRSRSPLSLIVIGHHPTEPGLNHTPQTEATRLALVLNRRKNNDMTDFLLCGTVMRDALRDIDIMCYAGADYQYIIVLPESSKSNADYALARIKKVVEKNIANHLVAGVAEFPADGLILEDLVGYASNSMKNGNVVTQLEKRVDLN